jgi:hypothetical protein
MLGPHFKFHLCYPLRYLFANLQLHPLKWKDLTLIPRDLCMFIGSGNTVLLPGNYS